MLAAVEIKILVTCIRTLAFKINVVDIYLEEFVCFGKKILCLT